MRKFLTVAAALLLSATGLWSQTTREEYIERYNLLVSKLGGAGVGIETLLDKWEEAYPDDLDMLSGRFVYYYTKSKSDRIEPKGGKATFMGAKPALTLKDSTGADINYFQESFFDDELFGEAVKVMDRIIRTYPQRLDMRFTKITALMSYEKESPDMALSELMSLIDLNYTGHPQWEYPGIDVVDNEVFKASVQEYCYTFFRLGVPEGYEAFRKSAEKMLSYNRDDVLFLNDMGSYYLVAKKDSRNALKYYNKVLKKAPDDITAIRNCVVLARNAKDVKLEKKYLPMLIKYGETEADRESARVRLDYLNKK
ncbi:MAG: hypothetical protein ACI4AE_00230 [Candidatus Cryptobacteroides sp.]